MSAARRRTAGFTVIELMLVLTVLGILAAIAIPVYQDYATRARIGEALAFAGPAKNAVTLFYMTNGALPASNAEADLGEPASMNSAVVESVEVLEDGVIKITLRYPGLSGHTLTMTPQAAASLLWSCSSSLPDNLLPETCRSQP